jgi:hypothetical protein
VKTKLAVALLAMAVFAVGAHAWPSCSGNWISVPAGTSSTNGAVVTENGQTFQCQKPTPTPTPTPAPTTISATSASNSAANSASSASNNQSQKQGQTQTANGGSASLKDSGNSSSTVKDSGNSSNSNVNSAQGGAANNNGNGSNNASYANTTNVEASKIPVETAVGVAPYPTANCSKGYGAGVQTMPIGISGGFSKIDENCAILETARSFDAYGERYAACKIKVNNKYAKKAGVTLEDCMRVVVVVAPVPVAVPTPTPAPVPNIIVNVPAPMPVVAPTVPIAEINGTLRNLGTCNLHYGKPTNVCYRVLDDAVRVLESQSTARLILTGPIESTKVLSYIDGKIARSRVELRLSDDANSTLTIETWNVQ